VRVVLDAAAFDVIDTEQGRELRAVLQMAIQRGGDVCCAAVTLAEVCRGVSRTRRVEAALVRDHGGQRVRVVPTTEQLAKLVGAILHDSGAGSERLADGHVVAVCAPAEAAIVITADPRDITLLASALPGTRIVTRDPEAPLRG
jgi:predicted nucleic acid-binding protein